MYTFYSTYWKSVNFPWLPACYICLCRYFHSLNWLTNVQVQLPRSWGHSNANLQGQLVGFLWPTASGFTNGRSWWSSRSHQDAPGPGLSCLASSKRLERAFWESLNCSWWSFFGKNNLLVERTPIPIWCEFSFKKAPTRSVHNVMIETSSKFISALCVHPSIAPQPPVLSTMSAPCSSHLLVFHCCLCHCSKNSLCLSNFLST